MVNEWLIFFGPAAPPISWITRKGFGHVFAAGWDPIVERWIIYDPTRRGTLITVCIETEAFHEHLGLLAKACEPHILRFAPRADRRLSPLLFSCTAAIKALLGLRSRALWPYGLYRHLRAQGAEIVEVPQIEGDSGQPILVTKHPAGAAGRSVDQGGTRRAGTAGEGGQDQGDPGPACAGNVAA